MAKSDNLRKAKSAKNDEFYTRLEDIEAEISQHKDYVRQFEGKTVFCNCDDPEWSNFFVFFKLHFRQLKLKKLITTHYHPDGSPSYKLEWAGEMLNDDMVNLIKTPLKGNGDFCSEECIEILKEADIVVTNPPFSLWREYVAQLAEYGKQYVIIGNNNAIAYKEVFPLLKEGKMFIGYHANETFVFKVANDYKYDPKLTSKINDGNKYGKVPAVTWFTNLDLDKSHEPLILTKNYYGNETRYPKYDNYDAIECGKVKDIPKDYFPCWYKCPNAGTCLYAQTEGKNVKVSCEKACNGVIGVPVTFLSDYCAEQFEILGQTTGRCEFDKLAWPIKKYENPKQYLFDKAKNQWIESNGSKINTGCELLYREKPANDTYYTADNADGVLKRLYNRVLIQRKLIKE